MKNNKFFKKKVFKSYLTVFKSSLHNIFLCVHFKVTDLVTSHKNHYVKIERFLIVSKVLFRHSYGIVFSIRSRIVCYLRRILDVSSSLRMILEQTIRRMDTETVVLVGEVGMGA